MNERIKTMWVEATGSVWPRPYKFTAGEYDTHLEKFAELIVRECIESVKEDMYSGAGCHSDFSTGGDWALETAINNIKEKYGVQP